MTRVHDVAVVGGGVAGATLAYELARIGVGVRLFEAARLGASSVPVALLNPHRGRTARARPSDLAGLEAFWRLTDRLSADGLAHGAHRTGVLRVAPSRRQAEMWRGVSAAHSRTRWLDRGEAPTGVHAPHGAMFVEDGGYVVTSDLLAALTTAARAAGATVETGSEVTRVGADGDLLRLELASSRGAAGALARHVVLCLGSAAPPEECRLPRLAAEGGVAAVLEVPEDARPALASLPPLAGAVNAAFHGTRLVVTGGSLPRERPRAEELRRAAIGLRDALAWAVPGITGAELVDAWFGVRSRRPTGVPVVRRIGPHATFYGGLAGRGFLCAADLSPRLAVRLAEKIAQRA